MARMVSPSKSSRVRGAAHQRQHQHAIDQPVGREGHRHRQHHAEDRIDPPEREHPEGGERRRHQKFAIGEIEDAGDAVLQIEADRDQRIHAAEHKPTDEDIEQDHSEAIPNRCRPDRSSIGAAAPIRPR